MKRVYWKSPVPSGIGHGARIYRPGNNQVKIADVIAERACVGFGVRVYRWPCGTVAIVTRDGPEDALLAAKCSEHLLGTYAKGAKVSYVLNDLLHAAEAA